MKIINDGIPEPIYNAMLQLQYQKTDAYASATRLLASPRQFHLEKRHWDGLEENASDRVWSLLGTLMHLALEEGSEDKNKEIRLETIIEGCKISGTADHFKDGILTDFKLTSVWTYIYGDRILDWEQQLNIYAYMLRQTGEDVKGLQIITIFRDWMKHKYQFERDYPNQIEVIPVRLWSMVEAEEWLTARIKLFKEYDDTPDNDLPLCTLEDKWQKPTKFAVMKKGNKRAVRVFEDEESAIDLLSKDAKYYIEERPSEPTKCLSYCPLKDICNQHQEYIKQQEVL